MMSWRSCRKSSKQFVVNANPGVLPAKTERMSTVNLSHRALELFNASVVSRNLKSKSNILIEFAGDSQEPH
jgi:hypothetical protein